MEHLWWLLPPVMIFKPSTHEAKSKLTNNTKYSDEIIFPSFKIAPINKNMKQRLSNTSF